MRRRTVVALIILFVTLVTTPLALPYLLNPGKQTYLYSSSISYGNSGQMVQSVDPNLLANSIFMNTSWQTAYLEKPTSACTLIKDADGNAQIIFNISQLNPGGKTTFAFTVRLEESARSPPKLSLAQSGNLSDIPLNLKTAYTGTVGSWVVDQDLRGLAHTIWMTQQNTTNVLMLTIALANWIGGHVKSVSQDVPHYPEETYHSLEGDCDDQANLLIALCHILGVPAYLQIGSLSWSSQTETFWNGQVTSNLNGITYHAWALVYVPPWGWLPFDMALGWSREDPFSVITSAKIWSLSTMVMMSITSIDWPGLGVAQKTSILSSSLSLQNDDSLTVQSESSSILLDWHFWATSILVLSLIVVTVVILRKKGCPQLEKP